MKKTINLILLPGMDGTNLLLPSVVTAVQKQYAQVNCICVAYPSDVLMDYQQLAEYVRQNIPDNEPYIILGESFSGPVAVLVASTASPMLKGVILAVTFVRNPKPIFSNVGGLLPNVQLSSKVLTQYFMPIISRLLLGNFANTDLRAALKNAIDRVPIATLRYRLQQVLIADVVGELSNIDVPMMYLLAKQDVLVKRHAYEVIKKHQPSLELVELDGPHMVLQVFPEKAAAMIGQFIEVCQ